MAGSPRMLAQHIVPQAQKLGDGPRLEWTASRQMRRTRVCDLRDMTETGVIKMMSDRVQESAARLSTRLNGAIAHTQPRLHKWPKQPGPHGPLVIGAVARSGITFIHRAICGVIGVERAQPERRQEPRFYPVHHAPRSLTGENSDGQTTDRKNLIGAERCVDRP